MTKRFKKHGLVTILAMIGLVVGFYFFRFGLTEFRPGTAEFTADVILDLAGLATTTYIASSSKCDYLTISGNNLKVFEIWGDTSFLLKTAGHKVLQLTPSGGTADLTFSSDYATSSYVSQWTEKSSVSVAHIVGVPKANTYYTVKANGQEIEGSPFNSGTSSEVRFIRTGAGKEVFTIAEVVSVSVSVSDGKVSYGRMPVNASKSTLDLNDMQTATNDGNVTENFNIKGQNASGGGCTWILASTTGSNQYVHQFCNDTDLDCSNPPTNYTPLITDYQSFATNITPSSTVDFQLRLITPTFSTCYATQSVDIMIQAVQP